MNVPQLKPDHKSEEFWSSEARAVSEHQVEVANLNLTLRSPLLSNVLTRGLNALLLGLLKDSAGSDKDKVLRVVKDITVIQPVVIPVVFLRRSRSELLKDQNANDGERGDGESRYCSRRVGRKGCGDWSNCYNFRIWYHEKDEVVPQRRMTAVSCACGDV